MILFAKLLTYGWRVDGVYEALVARLIAPLKLYNLRIPLFSHEVPLWAPKVSLNNRLYDRSAPFHQDDLVCRSTIVAG